MPSTNKTSLGLNQWVLSDQPVMNDFNSDNAILNAAIAALQQPIGTARIADGAVTGDKIADGAVTGEKLSGYPGTYLDSDDIDDVTDPGLYITPDATLVAVYEYGNPPTGVAQTKIDTECRVSFRSQRYDTESWSPWRSYEPLIRNGSITTAKLAGESVNFEKLSADMLGQAKSFITEISGTGQPQAIPLTLGPGFSADKAYKLSIEARLVSGSGTVDLGPNVSSPYGYYRWDTTGEYLTLTSDWQTAWVDNMQKITSAGLQLYGSSTPVVIQLRNIHLTDADGNDVIDRQALREVGTCIPSPDDTPENIPENKRLPTLAYVQDMLAELEARIAALEGGNAE